jgi:hypothetical protein
LFIDVLNRSFQFFDLFGFTPCVLITHESMEAVAEHDFTASQDDELSFRRGQVLKVKLPSINRMFLFLDQELSADLVFFAVLTYSTFSG